VPISSRACRSLLRSLRLSYDSSNHPFFVCPHSSYRNSGLLLRLWLPLCGLAVGCKVPPVQVKLVNAFLLVDQQLLLVCVEGLLNIKAHQSLRVCQESPSVARLEPVLGSEAAPACLRERLLAGTISCARIIGKYWLFRHCVLGGKDALLLTHLVCNN
jgi:hypothetical protein